MLLYIYHLSLDRSLYLLTIEYLFFKFYYPTSEEFFLVTLLNKLEDASGTHCILRASDLSHVRDRSTQISGL